MANILDYDRRKFQASKKGRLRRLLDGFVEKAMGYVGMSMAPDDFAVGMTPEQLASIMSEATRGETQQQAVFFGNMLEKDTRLASLFETRVDSVMSADWNLLPAGQSPYEPVTDKDLLELKSLLVEANIRGLMRHLVGEALLVGYGGAYLEWAPGGASVRWHEIDRSAWIFDEAGNPALRDRENNESPLADFHQNQFVIHYHRLKAGHPGRSGLGRHVAWYWLFKYLAMTKWCRYVEKFGLPFLMAKVSRADFDNEDVRNRILEGLRDLASDNAFLTTEEGGVEVPTMAGQNNRIHEQFVSMVNKEYTLLILRQMGSSEGEKGRLGNNDAMANVEQDMRESDCLNLCDTIQRSLVTPLWQFRHGLTRPPPEFIMEFRRMADVLKATRSVLYLRQAGYTPTVRCVSKECALELEPEVQDINTKDSISDDTEE